MTSSITQLAENFLEAYSNFPRGKYASFVIVRKTESETLFRTEGAGEDLSKEFVRAGISNDEIIQRVLMTKRKQTAVERRNGRDLLREHKHLYAKDEKSGECALNRNNACEKCIDCMLYGYAVGGGGAQKSRVLTEDAFSILKAGVVTGKRTGNALYDNSTMRDPETGKASQAIFEEPYIKPETHFLEIETLKDVTIGEWVYVLGNILRSTRYGAVSSRQGRIKNTLAMAIFSDCEVFSNLELTQHVYDFLKQKDQDLNFPSHDSDVLGAVETIGKKLIENIASKRPGILGLDDVAKIEQSIVKVYRSADRVEALLNAIEKGYSTDRKEATASHTEVIRLLEEAENES
jgi:CRISPR-associated protein Csc2